MGYCLLLRDVALDALFSFVQTYLPGCRAHIAVVGVCHFARSVYDAAHDAYFQVGEVRCSLFHALNGGLQVEKCASAARAGDIFGLGGAQACRLQYSEAPRHEFVGVYRCVEHNSCAKSVHQATAHIHRCHHLHLHVARRAVVAVKHHRGVVAARKEVAHHALQHRGAVVFSGYRENYRCVARNAHVGAERFGIGDKPLNWSVAPCGVGVVFYGE